MGAAMTPVIRTAHLSKTYASGHQALKQVDLTIKRGEIFALLGPNGAGKTTTFYMVVGLVPATAGRVRLDGEDITGLRMHERARRGIGYLSQEPSVFRKLSVRDNLMLILELQNLTAQRRRERADHGGGRHRLPRRPGQPLIYSVVHTHLTNLSPPLTAVGPYAKSGTLA